MGLEIHELNTFEGTPGANDYLATDNGNETKKISTEQLLAAVNAALQQMGVDLNSRIDNIIAGGAAPSESEIVDARHGADGVDYASLGTAIRTQISDIKSDLSAITTLDGIWESGGISGNNGTKNSNNTRITSPLLNRDINVVCPTNLHAVGVCVWDNTGGWLGYLNGSSYVLDENFTYDIVDISGIDKSYTIRIVVKKNADPTITVSAKENILFGFSEQSALNKINENSADISNIATSHINILENLNYADGYYYNGFVKSAASGFKTFPLIPVKAGTTYYYRSLQGVFCRYRYYNDTQGDFTSDASKTAGTFTATKDGYVAITSFTGSEALFTTSEELYNSGSRKTILYPNKLYIEKNNIANDLIRKSENNLIDGANFWDGTWINGGSWITDTETYRGLIVKKRTGSWSGIHKAVNVEAGKHYHFTAYFKCSSAVSIQVALTQTASTASVYMWDEKGYSQVQNMTLDSFVNRADKWRKINVEFECTASGTIHPLIQAIASTTLYVCGFSVSEGYNQDKPVFNCLKNGDADFDSLTEAVRFATMFFDSTVFVGAGDWDVVDELGSSYMESVGASKRGLYLKNRIRLVFSSNSRVLAHYEGSREDTMLWFAPFNSAKYGFTLENANIQASKVRYAFHDERNAEDDQYTNYFINCKMYLDNTDNTATTAHQCIGGGLGLNGHVVIEGGDYQSVFPAHKPSSGYRPISYHNSAGAGKNRIDIQNVYIHDGGIRLNYYGQSTDVTECYVTNCSFTEDIISGPETNDESSPNVNMLVIKWNNEIRTNIY